MTILILIAFWICCFFCEISSAYRCRWM